MSDKNNTFYITTTLPYINAEPHIGFAAEIIKADVIARYNRQRGKEVFFNTGTDEHGLKIYRKAQELGINTQEYCDKYAAEYDNLKKYLNVSYTNFIRTTDEKHVKATQEFWLKCEANGDIYKKNYQVNYCVGCELEKTDSELIDGRCPHHTNMDLEIIDEENYFFRFSKYQDKLLKLYKNNPDFVFPAHRLKEISNFVEKGLQDFSISRLKSKMPWGVPVPNDDEQVMYVWFDALVNYISTLDWPQDEDNFKKFWPALQVAGKDNLRQQSAMWQAMLMSAGLPTSKQILIFGFLTIDGQKISKSLGNTINPFELTDKYGTDAVRYYLLSEIGTFADGDFSYEKFEDKFNADLANGIGNLVARVSNMLEKNNIEIKLEQNSDKELLGKFNEEMEEFDLNGALKVLWEKIKESDNILSEEKPWKMEDIKEIKKVLENISQNIFNIAELLKPFLPETAEKIITQFSEKQIKKSDSLFLRI